MAGPSRPRPDIVDEYRRIDNLSEWCDRRLFAIHGGRYSHLNDFEFWLTFRDSLRQWADDQARPAGPPAERPTERWWTTVAYNTPYRRYRGCRVRTERIT